jgi:uncharacterized protein YkwD
LRGPAWRANRAVTLALLPAAAPAAPCAGADALPTAAGLTAYADTTLCLINAARAADALLGLRRNGALDRASTAYSRDMVAESFFAHVAPDGTTLVGRLARARYVRTGRDWIVGENLA